MVRKRQTQPVRVPTGRPYGAASEIEAAQQAVPLPAQAAPQPGSAPVPATRPGAAYSPAGPPGDATAPPPGAGGVDPALALAAAAGVRAGPGMLSGPSLRPTEPVTTGLTAGIGPGPEVLGASPSISEAFGALAREAKDSEVAYLADLINRIGL
jgi:hypothetical protein